MLSRVSGTSQERSGDEGVPASHSLRSQIRPRWEPVRRLSPLPGTCSAKRVPVVVCRMMSIIDVFSFVYIVNKSFYVYCTCPAMNIL